MGEKWNVDRAQVEEEEEEEEEGEATSQLVTASILTHNHPHLFTPAGPEKSWGCCPQRSQNSTNTEQSIHIEMNQHMKTIRQDQPRK